MKTFRKTWNNRAVEDDGCYMSKEATSFCRAFRNMLKRELSPYGVEVVDFHIGHYYLSCFLKANDRYVYVNYNVPRYGKKINFDELEYAGPCLYRTAENSKDYHGGSNHFCSISELPRCVLGLLKLV